MEALQDSYEISLSQLELYLGSFQLLGISLLVARSLIPVQKFHEVDRLVNKIVNRMGVK